MFLRLLLLVAAWMPAQQEQPPWTKTINCAAGTEYRDVRQYAGRLESCVLPLGGGLSVDHGPSRSWFSYGHPGEEGRYDHGRKVGRWKECNRFGRCRTRQYEAATKPVVPVSFSKGKYVFDFRSCWSTWVTRADVSRPTHLNIGGAGARCQIAHSPDRSSYGDPDSYSCSVPRAVGVRSFDSIDLRAEFPKAGLPQFCGASLPPLDRPQPYGFSSGALWMSRGSEMLANFVDVECAARSTRANGVEVLSLRLNKYAEELVLRGSKAGRVTTTACSSRFTLQPLEYTRDAAGRSLFNFALLRTGKRAAEQRACLDAHFTSVPVCSR